MLELNPRTTSSVDDIFTTLAPLLGDAPGPSRARAYGGPERRGATSLQRKRLAQMLDTLDHGLLLLASDGQVDQMNKAARLALDELHPLQLDNNRLVSRLSQDACAWQDALQAAAGRGLRRMLRLGSGQQVISVAVVPLAPLSLDGRHGVAVLLGRRLICEPLTLDFYARCHGLTMAESTVLRGLCADLSPQQIADRQRVGLATVRTQIGSIRQKTGADSIRALLRQLALLPPLVGVLDTCCSAVDEHGRPQPRPLSQAGQRTRGMPC